MNFNYYKEQLDKLEINDYNTIKIYDGNGNSTKFLTLNLESIKELKKYLDKLEKIKK